MTEKFPTAEVKKNTKQIAEDFKEEMEAKDRKGENIGRERRVKELSPEPDFKLDYDQLGAENRELADIFLKQDEKEKEYVDLNNRKSEADLDMSTLKGTQESLADIGLEHRDPKTLKSKFTANEDRMIDVDHLKKALPKN